MIEVKPYPFIYKIFDTLLMPAMYLISRALNEAPQETHAWQLQKISANEREKLDRLRMVSLPGAYRGYLGKGYGGIMFHIPFLGGWKEYVVLEANEPPEVWHLGWYTEDGGEMRNFEVNRLQLFDPRVRVLRGPAGTTAHFFATTADGVQVPLRGIGEGKIGDKKFPFVRLL